MISLHDLHSSGNWPKWPRTRAGMPAFCGHAAPVEVVAVDQELNVKLQAAVWPLCIWHKADVCIRPLVSPEEGKLPASW